MSNWEGNNCLSLLPCPLLAALIRGNRKNCAQFSGSLDWLISRLERLEASSGTFSPWMFLPGKHARLGSACHEVLHCVTVFPGILEVLHCVLVESPEALNLIKEGHIKSIISLLDKHGRNHKVDSTQIPWHYQAGWIACIKCKAHLEHL